MAESAARSGLSRGVDTLRVKIRDKGLVKNKTQALLAPAARARSAWM